LLINLRAYFNEKAATWDGIAAERDTAKLERMAKRFNIKLGSTVLDVGAGTGVLLPYLFSSIGKKGRIVALDIAEEMLKKARAKGFDGNIDYLQADITDIPLRNETFDSVVCYSSFPHFRDKLKAVMEMNRVLKSGGRMWICHTSSRAEINEMHRQEPTMRNDILPDSAGMRLLLAVAGFTGIKVEDNSDSYLASAEKPK